jgi:hypothetical protein
MGVLFWIGAVISLLYFFTRIISVVKSEFKIGEFILMVLEIAGTVCVSAFIFIFLDFLGWVKW